MNRSKREQDGALFSIGQTAKLFDMNIRTLRYYDQIGLLEPEFVNEESGYRYYSSRQFERLNTIKYLRALDVPIERITEFFADRDVALMKVIFEQQLRTVQTKKAELDRIECKITRRLEQIEYATQCELGAAELVDMPERRIVSLAESFTSESDLEPLIRDLGNRARLDDAIFLGKVGVSVSHDDLLSGSFNRLSSVFIVVEDADEYFGESDIVPAGKYAQIRFKGTHSDSTSYYRELIDYCAEAGLQLQGPSVETTLIDAGMTSDESQFVTEIQIPVL